MTPADLPPVVYVPCFADDDGQVTAVQLRTTADGRTALLAYSALDRLKAGAGDVPWVLLTIEDLQRVHDREPYDVLYMDLRIPEHARAAVTR
ncbi:SAV_915 family protein [Sanguibacter suaedae]|uniref:SseB family protein n=1 Tax=Sanguibacter suaedae TaxID=2795737 RepID=A0A934IAS1_9MICO|nr:SAV_915 family protein [Sanguibacter suaedae]MBI9113439.1 SseB family protein [Sanguibacter suaedae]